MTEQKKSASLKEDILFLVLKLLIFFTLIAVMVFFVFGIYRCSDNMMSPAFKDGDLAIYYRVQKEFHPSDTVIVEKDGETQIRRIVAKPGDSVEITADGLKINGYLQQETGIYTETLPYTEGISFPVTLEENEYFVLGDNRSGAKDSRIYGAVKKEEIKGTVIVLLRHRGF
ncbi:MAG: signal peptidase I [Blautia sp.]|nr:signal peptidase I [Blautia sp.]